MDSNKIIIRDSFHKLGTEIDIRLVAEESQKVTAKKTIKDLEVFYDKKENILTRFKPESELSKLNSHLEEYVPASKEIIDITRDSLKYYQKTNSYFDPRIISTLEKIGYCQDFKQCEFLSDEKNQFESPSSELREDLKINGNQVYFGSRMDFAGIAKGYITDQAVLFLKEKGWENFLINSGGDIYASGKDESDEKWKISIEGLPEEIFSFFLENQAVATSGVTRRKWEKNGKRLHHLINPKAPNKFDFQLKTVTVVAKETKEADVWAKTLFLMGKERGLSFSKDNAIESFFLDSRGNLFLAKNLK